MRKGRTPHIYRFQCEDCNAARDQQMYRKDTNRITCICGGSAHKTQEGYAGMMELDWWTDLDGNLVMEDQSASWTPPPVPKSSIWQRISRLMSRS